MIENGFLIVDASLAESGLQRIEDAATRPQPYSVLAKGLW